MRKLYLIMFSSAIIVCSGCSQVQLESQKAALKQQEAELQKHSIELETLKSKLSEIKQKNIDLETKSSSAVQLLAEANLRNEMLQQDLFEVKTRLNAAVRLLTTEPESNLAVEPNVESKTNVEAKLEMKPEAKMKSDGEAKPIVNAATSKPANSN